MATPHVSGVAALVKSMNHSLTAVQIKNIILSTVDVKSSLSGKVNSGGRLNAYRAVMATLPAPPVADFTAIPMSGVAPLTVVFTDLSMNGPIAWNWTFGDGEPPNATVQNPVHTYLTPGVYNVSLNVTNAGGSNFFTRAGYIDVIHVNASRIGVFRPMTHLFYADYNGNGAWDGPIADRAFSFGITGDIPISGDWNIDGRSRDWCIPAFNPYVLS